MIRNYIKVALRNILRYKIFAFINIAGLVIGMTACLLILLFIKNELSYENMHGDLEKMHRVLTIDKALGTNNQRVGITMPGLGPAIVTNFPEVAATHRLTFGNQTLLKYQDRLAIYANQLRSADANFFSFFDYPLLIGNPATVLESPYSIVLTETLAHQIFGNEEAVGQTLTAGGGYDLLVTGIMADLPENTHLEFDALQSISTITANANPNQPPFLESWQIIAMPTYVKFHEAIDPKPFDGKFTQLCRDNNVAPNFDITLQPLSGTHLWSTDVIFDPVANKGDSNNIYIFGAIAVLILIIASVNYINLSTARSAQRAKEVGLRKVVGSSRLQLLLQFITESLLISGIALLLVLPLAQLATPFLNALADTAIAFNTDSLGMIITFLIVALIVVGGLAGFYPALVLSRYKPVTVLKGSFGSSGTGNLLRKTLVILQFTLSIALICLTLIVKKQMDYIQNKDLGYDREQVLIVDMFDPSMGAKLDLFRSELLQHSAFSAAAISSNLPGRTFGRTGVRPEGAAAEDIWIWSTITVTPETLPTLGMEIKEGRNFSREMSSDTSGVVLVNDIAIRKLGWDDPIGRRLYFGAQDSIGQQIIGVVKDFHFVDFSQPIEPVVIFPIRNRGKNVLVARIAPGMIPPAIEHAEKIWTQIYSDYPFSYGFMDDEFNALYRQVTNTSRIMDIFAGLAIFIAALGLFGLVSHATTQRTKEIGIRKVVGASTTTIVRILILDFLRLVSLSILIAVPIAWYGGTKWLESFVYRTSPGYAIFLIAGATALLIAIITVSFQAIKAALANPVKSLRYE